MIITFTAKPGTNIKAEHYLGIVQGALEKTSSFYGGNLKWHEDEGLVVKLLNSVKMRLEGRLLVKDAALRGAAIIDGQRCLSASVSANARLVENIHAAEPTAVIQVGNVFYQREVPPPTKKGTPPTTVPAATQTTNVTAPPPSTTPDGISPSVAAAVAASKATWATPGMGTVTGSPPPELPAQPTDADIESYYDHIYGGGGVY